MTMKTHPIPVHHTDRLRLALLCFVATLISTTTDRAATPGGISDGTSNTILIGEGVGGRFDNRSTGVLGEVVIDENKSIELPLDGILHFKSLKVLPDKTLSFTRNAHNTPVYILSQGDVSIEGVINISGSRAPENTPTGGLGGPGGFDGGKPGFGEVPPGAGYGPGGGKGGNTDSHSKGGAGSGSYSTVSPAWSNPNKGAIYGSKLLIPMIGGSGGGGAAGTPGKGGGGGGGAVLVSSNTRILISGKIFSNGGAANGAGGNVGSGGAVRLVAPQVAGTGEINVNTQNDWAGHGRIRVDTLDRSQLRLNFQPLDSLSVGANMFVFPPLVPKLDVIEVAGNVIQPGSGPVTLQLPFGSDPNLTVKIKATGWNRIVPIQVVLTPDSGAPTVFKAQIDNRLLADGSVRIVGFPNSSTVSVPVVFPVNTLVTIHCWNVPSTGEILPFIEP